MFAVCKHRSMELPRSPTELAKLLNISKPYASQLLSGARPWTRALAIAAWLACGAKLGPLEGVPDAEIEVLARFEAGAAA